jgi:hypothetical protein
MTFKIIFNLGFSHSSPRLCVTVRKTRETYENDYGILEYDAATTADG